MRNVIVENLSAHIESRIVEELIEAYGRLIAAYRQGDLETCLSSAGRFVEHTLRVIEYIRTGSVLTEIKLVSKTIKAIENDARIPEALQIIIPREIYGMMYTIRSKRDAVHVKEIDPQYIDGALCVQAGSWVISELLRLFHTSDERAISETMAELMRGYLPFVQEFGDEIIVTKKVPCEIEMLLLLSSVQHKGFDRRALGRASKFASSTVTSALKRLDSERHIHRDKTGVIHITGAGEQSLSEFLASL